MKELRKLWPFALIIGMYCMVALWAVFSCDKLNLHLMINRFHSPFFDAFFKYFTNVGDGAFAVVFLPLFLFKTDVRTFILAVLSCALAGILAQFAKRTIFPAELRPTASIDPNLLHLVEGVKMATQHSFPSGHSASAFALMAVLAFVFRNNRLLQAILAVCAVLTAFSRVYLSQHFLVDTVAGGLLGIVAFAVAFLISSKWRLPANTIAGLFRQKPHNN